jgi:hypothetical protein
MMLVESNEEDPESYTLILTCSCGHMFQEHEFEIRVSAHRLDSTKAFIEHKCPECELLFESFTKKVDYYKGEVEW